jgi:predicted Zn-dependent protease
MVDKDGFLSSAAVYLQPAWDYKDDAVLAVAMRHELGHCLGLAHDEYEESIMFKVASDRQTHVSEHDKKLLRETYDLSA